MARELFGTDGVRGLANTHPMTADIALRIAEAVSGRMPTALAMALRRGPIRSSTLSVISVVSLAFLDSAMRASLK